MWVHFVRCTNRFREICPAVEPEGIVGNNLHIGGVLKKRIVSVIGCRKEKAKNDVYSVRRGR